MGEAFGIKIAHAAFTSDYSNRIADQAGFNIDKEIRWIVSIYLSCLHLWQILCLSVIVPTRFRRLPFSFPLPIWLLLINNIFNCSFQLWPTLWDG